ncbi:MAG: 4Fe-4S binding protein [Ruminococcus sp.]|jgi:2-oxoglutarate ferredoxin oxidoreductase subunit delta|nr:4Fe-4S binding protein [Ruminococcus sp.]
MKAKEKVYTDVARCKGCGYCIQACPKQAVTVSDHINENGYNVIQVDENNCIACGICYRVCPDYVFEIR